MKEPLDSSVGGFEDRHELLVSPSVTATQLFAKLACCTRTLPKLRSLQDPRGTSFGNWKEETVPVSVPGYHEAIPNDAEFRAMRDKWRSEFSKSDEIHAVALSSWLAASQFMYGYQWEWNGVPVIRWPDDIVLLQELIWQYKPTLMIETGVARGGSVVMAASLMAASGIPPNVLGIDVAILPHTMQAVTSSIWASAIELLEADSIGAEAVSTVRRRIGALRDGDRVFLTLDSNHTEVHVLAELRALAPLLPVGSFILVADTIVEELPEDMLSDRPWGRGNSPLSALREFLASNSSYELAPDWTRRAMLSEFRDGIVFRTK